LAAILRRNPDPVIDLKAPWSEDPFERRKEGEVLAKLIAASADEPLVISLQSPWGSGKTVFLKRVAAHVHATYRMPAVVIDAWKSDDCDDALATIVAELTALLAKRAKKTPSIAGRADRAVSQLALHGSRVVLPAVSLYADIATPGAGEALRLAGNYFTHLLDAERIKKDATADFRSALKEAQLIITNTRKGSRPLPMLLIIDELDRCRPDHAIRLLERIKHYFDVPGITFLIATDHGNLPSAVKTVYGNHVDGELYLRKFFDYEFHLRPPSPLAFGRLLVRNNIYPGTEIPDRETALDGSYYFHDLGPQHLSCDVKKFEYAESFSKLSALMNLSLRDQGQAITVLSAFVSTYDKKRGTIPVVDCFVACFRFGFPSRFRSFLETGHVDLAYNDQSSDKAQMVRLQEWHLFPHIRNFFMLKFDGNDADRSIFESMRKAAGSVELMNDAAAAFALFVYQLRASNTGGPKYAMSVARLTNSFAGDET
jgi:hypothetical protein